MTASRPSADLTIPDAAVQAYFEHHGYQHYVADDGDLNAIRAIARPVVAQFLRDLATAHDRVTGGFLAELADSLDPPADDETTARRTTRSVLRDAPDADAEAERARKGTPWCDTCQRPSYGGAGLRNGREHVNPATGWGPDPWPDHVVTHHQWFATPGTPAFRESDLDAEDGADQ